MVQQTSIDAYHQLEDLNIRQTAVYNEILYHQPVCNMDIAKFLDKPINEITPRTNELVSKGKVDIAYKAKHPVTNRTVIYWSIKKEVENVSI